MKTKTIGFLFVFALMLSLLLFVFSFLHKAGVKNVHNFSDSKATSKLNGFYITDYVPTKKIIKLKHWPVTVILDSAWVECKWFEEANFLNSTLEKSENGNYNAAFKIKSISTDDFVFALDLPDNIGNTGGYNPTTKQHEGTLYDLPDTLKVTVSEKNPVDSIGWIKHLVTDTILYIKCK